jgi:hypothetical protein
MARKHTPIKDPVYTLIDKHETSDHTVPSVVTLIPESTGMLRERLNEIDMALRNAQYMADFAAELVGALDGDGAPEGYFKIPFSDGNRLAFCCNDLLQRVEDMISLLCKEPA